MRSLLITLLIAMLLLAGGTAGAVQVKGAAERADVPSLQTMQSDGVSLSQAVEQVRRQYNGRIVSAETIVNGNGETHVIKVLMQDGKVITVRVPGKRNN
jgi:hypothetical protein